MRLTKQLASNQMSETLSGVYKFEPLHMCICVGIVCSIIAVWAHHY